MFYRLLSLVTGALTEVCFVNTVEVGPEAYLPSFHLRDDRADRSGQVPVYIKDLFAWFYP
jgi:hypothetical protein